MSTARQLSKQSGVPESEIKKRLANTENVAQTITNILKSKMTHGFFNFLRPKNKMNCSTQGNFIASKQTGVNNKGRPVYNQKPPCTGYILTTRNGKTGWYRNVVVYGPERKPENGTKQTGTSTNTTGTGGTGGTGTNTDGNRRNRGDGYGQAQLYENEHSSSSSVLCAITRTTVQSLPKRSARRLKRSFEIFGTSIVGRGGRESSETFCVSYHGTITGDGTRQVWL
jgi:hypothetical protein